MRGSRLSAENMGVNEFSDGIDMRLHCSSMLLYVGLGKMDSMEIGEKSGDRF